MYWLLNILVLSVSKFILNVLFILMVNTEYSWWNTCIMHEDKKKMEMVVNIKTQIPVKQNINSCKWQHVTVKDKLVMRNIIHEKLIYNKNSNKF